MIPTILGDEVRALLEQEDVMGRLSTNVASLGALQVQFIQDSSNLIGVALIQGDATVTKGPSDLLEASLTLSPLGDHDLVRPRRAWKEEQKDGDEDCQADGNRTY
jgi:hypothetical protein